MVSVIPFSSKEITLLNRVGGKALSLITMTREGMPVPPGFVITVEFFEPWITALQGTPEWEAVQNAEKDEFGQTSKALQAKGAELHFSFKQREEIDEALRNLQLTCTDAFFAVRSSSPEEDLESASFAGGYETTLGVTLETLESAIRSSFISAFDKRIYLYKKAHGFNTSQPRIAVIVQQLVDADSAGVAFSLNPLNNCFDEAVINANTGLGESVVNGETDPDVFIVDKNKRQILDTRIGGKQLVVTLDREGGTARSARTAVQQASVTQSQVLQLTDLIVKIEKIYQKPIDIEWAIADDQISLLQVRPITTYLPLPEVMITPPGSRKKLYADNTLIEQGVQKPLSVLGTDFMRYVLNTMTGPMGGDASDIESGAFTAGGRYYMNLSRTLQMKGPMGGLAPGSYGDTSVKEIIDSIDLDQYLPEKQSLQQFINLLKGPLKMAPLMIPVLKAFRNPEWILAKYHKALPGHLQKLERAINSNLSLHQQATNLTALLHFFFYEYGLPLVFAPQIAEMRIRKIFAEEEELVKEQLMSLGTSLPGNKTAEMGKMMFDLAASDTIKEHISTDTFFTQLEQRTLDPGFLNAWDAYVAEFGARCPREIDAATPRPNEYPGKLFEQLKAMSPVRENENAAGNIFLNAKMKREAAYDTLYKLALQKGKRWARSLKNLYKIWVTLGGYRETPKHYVINVIDMFRKHVLKIAENFVQAGRLDDPDQIFDLTIKDIDNALADASIDLRAVAAERVVLINKINRSPLVARIIDSRGKIYYPPRKQAAEGELAGIPISPGVVQGKVKVFHSADEKKLFPGEILVTRATDPGWTPLFINAGGIILEIGGALQHGAVVAREYGIPCVSGLAEATEMLKDGQLVEVDGSNGIVRILDEDIP